MNLAYRSVIYTQVKHSEMGKKKDPSFLVRNHRMLQDQSLVIGIRSECKSLGRNFKKQEYGLL